MGKLSSKMSDTEFKAKIDSITYADILKLRETKAKHALKLDDLDIPLHVANEYVDVITEFLDGLNFSSDRIEAFECRSRSGYIPFSHNKGGLEGIAYRDQYSACENTGFKGTDAALARGYKYDLECWMEENKHPSTDSMNDADFEAFDEWRQNSDQDTIQFQARVMLTSETTANVDFYVSASDSPYHRKSDDKLELSIEFKSPAGLKRKLKTIARHAFVQKLACNVREGF